VSDIATAVEFYTKKLGFTTAFTWHPPYWTRHIVNGAMVLIDRQ
jgi:catechol 2,3-dioxygenase-like lactoylglutathione lyase family enzyme